METDYDKVWFLIQRERGLREAGGVFVNGDWFHTDLSARLKFLGLKDKARDAKEAGKADDYVLTSLNTETGLIENIEWKLIGEERYVPVTIKLAYAVVEAVGNLDLTLYKRAATHKYYMLQSTNPLEYDFSTGWPQSYKDYIESMGGVYVPSSVL